MLEDLVIDTNVLMHAQNPNEARFSAARQLIERMHECTTLLCVDEGFDTDAARNRSMIGTEYLSNLQAGSLGLTLVVSLVDARRLKQVERLPPVGVSRAINQLIRKRRDRTFLGVSCNSNEKRFASHDYKDFPQAKRNAIRQRLGVLVFDAGACVAALR